MIVCDVRNTSLGTYKFVGYSKTNAFPENVAYWPGVSPPNVMQRTPVDPNSGTPSGAPVFVSPASSIAVFSGIVKARGAYTHPPRTLTTACNTDVRGTDCPIITSIGNVELDTLGNPYFAYYVNIQTSVLSGDLNSFAAAMPGCVIILIEKKTGKLLAGSDPQYLLTTNNGTTLIDATAYGHPLASQAASVLKRTFQADYSGIGDGPNQTQHYDFKFLDTTTNLGSVLANINYITDGTGLEWMIVLAVAETSFIGNYLSAVISVSIIGGAIAVVCLIICIITNIVTVRPLVKLMRQMLMVQDMQLEDVDTCSRSVLGEIRAMQTSFDVMVSKLKEYKAFLPSYILNRDFGEMEEDEETEKVQETSSNVKGNLQSIPSRRSCNTSLDSSGKSRSVQKFMLGIEMREISVVHVTIANMEQLLVAFSPKELVLWHGRLLAEIQRISHKMRADLTYFDQNEFVLTWNTVTHLRRHAWEACSAALMIKRFSEQIYDDVGFVIRIGAAIGDARCGTMGTETKRQFCVFGRVRQHAESLCKLNAEWNSTILVTEAMYNAAAKDFEARPIVRYSYTKENEYVEHTAYELMFPRKKHTDSEWMYEMDSKLERYDVFYRSFNALNAHDVSLACQTLKEYAEEQTIEDPVLQKMIITYEQLLKRNATSMVMEMASNTWTTAIN
jgi:hypothetical protein